MPKLIYHHPGNHMLHMPATTMPTIATTTTTATISSSVTNLSSPADSFTAAWRAQADPDPAPGIHGVCDHQASGTDSFDDLCDEWEGKALHRLVWRFSAASTGHRYGSKRHVRLMLRDTLCGPKLCGPKLQ
jgi:hypothetical protein